MGTSTSYSAPPSWSALKNEVTRAARAGSMPTDKARQLLQGFIRNNGGSGALAGRGGGDGRGGAVASGQAARGVAKRLGNFISDVGRIGFENALRKAGWSDLIGRPVSEILNALLDRVGGDASTIEDVDARMALSKLQAEYFADAATIEELEQRLINQGDKLEIVLRDFFGLYLYELFCRVFFERLVQRVGDIRANSFLKEISDFIKSTLANRVADRDISQIDWAGSEGETITAEIMETTLNVFGG